MLALAVGMSSTFAQKFLAPRGEQVNTPVLTSIQAAQGNEQAPVMSFAPVQAITTTSHQAYRNYEDWETALSNSYDLQSNSLLGNRIVVWEDGTAACVGTWDNSGSTSYANRGSAYNYYDGSDFGEMPENRIESVYSGWPSIATLGNGEIFASHGGGNVNVFKRDVKGEGDWQSVHTFTNWTWPRIGTTHNGQYVYAVFADQDSNNTLINYIKYSRSTDGGATWSEPDDPPMVDVAGMYRNDIGADDYVIATNGDRVAIMFAGMNYDLFYIYSEDNGETWTKQIVYQFPYDHSLDWNQTAISSDTDTIWAVDNSASIAIDNAGVVHVAFALGRWTPAPDSGAGYYSYWPYTDAIVYWNSEYVNEQGTHEIPMFGDWSGDANFPGMLLNGTDGASSTLNDERLFYLAQEEGNNNLNIFFPFGMEGTTVGTPDYTDFWDNRWGSYRTLGIASMPAISVDEYGNICISYTALNPEITGDPAGTGEFYFRDAVVTARDSEGTWFYDCINLNDDFIHSGRETYNLSGYPIGTNAEFWVSYWEDDFFGLFIDDDQSSISDNSFYAVKVNLNDVEGFDYVGEVTNPMTSARVYPNPTNGTLYVEVNASQSSEAVMTVFNIMGQKVAEKNVNLTTGIHTTSINTNELSSGVYFVTVKANGFEKTMKFVVK